MTKEIAEQESRRQATDRGVVHLHREGTFMRAYDWSAWLCCRYLNDFKVNKRQFKSVEQPVAFIGFPLTSLAKWMPEGAEQRVAGEKQLDVTLPEAVVTDDLDVMAAAYAEWKEAVPLGEQNPGQRKRGAQRSPFADADEETDADVPGTLTGIMQRVLAFPIESRSPIESMTFLADIKRQLASLV